MKYSYEKKLESVLLVLNSGCSRQEVARLIGSSPEHIRRWVARYRAHGEYGLRIKKGSYSGDFKQSVVTHMHENHLSLFETAVKFGIPSASVLRRWDRIYCAEGPSGLYKDNRGKMKTSKKPTSSAIVGPEDVQKELAYLRAENAYLKKLRALVEERIARESGSAPKPSSD